MNHASRRQCRPALGTLVEVTIHACDLPDYVRAQQALFDTAFAAIAQVEREMSFHAPTSALSRLNLAAAGDTIELPARTYDVLATALRIFHATDGMFDCGVGARLVHEAMLPDHGFRRGAEPASLSDIELAGGTRVTVHQPTCIDLGGIAKGYAVDQAIAALADAGVHNCRVNAGGDIRMAGALAEDIFIRHPAAPGIAVLLGQLENGAVATSAPYYSLRGHGEDRRCALLDPHGASLVNDLSYTVLAPTCIIADALTKAVAVAYHRRPVPPASLDGSMPQPFHAAFLDQFDAQAYIIQAPVRHDGKHPT